MGARKLAEDKGSRSTDEGKRGVEKESPGNRRFAVGLHPLELLVVAAFLGLVFLLGFFPLKDTDFWWHLRTGDWIRANGQVPQKDMYTYTVPDAEWIDLHWGYQVLISIGYAAGGVPLLNLGKAVITTAAVAVLLLGCRRHAWSLWIAVLAWLPALGVLSGRMYVRPETISLWWMSLVIWVVWGWREHPGRMWLLPVVFLFWVNTQGLFALGFVILAMGIVDAAIRPSMWRRDRRDWWGRLIAACGLSVIACLFNPYGLRGLLFPLTLVGTMGNPVFRTIGELTPIPQFIRSLGIADFPAELTLGSLPAAIRLSIANFPAFPLPLKLHLGAMALGLVSFVWLLAGGISAHLRQASNETASLSEGKIDANGETRKGKSRRPAPNAKPSAERVGLFAGLSPFRLMMWGFFSLLSLQATRNSHQFGAVMGLITAANFAEGASLFARARRAKKAERRPESFVVSPGNAVSLAVVGLVISWVGTGQYYNDAGEGRTIGWGEEPLWFPHEAVKAAGAEELPGKFASFHNGHAALYDYYFGPEKKVFSDARLEVIGPVLYQKQTQLSTALNRGDAGWRSLVNGIGRPVILADHASNSGVSVTLLAAKDYVCIHFDPIAAVFAPAESVQGTSIRPFDFLAAHYDSNGFRAFDSRSRVALTRAFRNVAGGLAAIGRDDLARPINLAGVGLALGLIEEDAGDREVWKLLGQLLQAGASSTLQRDEPPVAFDPVDDLPLLRCIAALRVAVELSPGDFSPLYSLAMIQRGLAQADQELDSLRKLVAMTPINTTQAAEIANSKVRIAELERKMAADLPAENSKGAGRAEIERTFDRLVRDGRLQEAADTLGAALPQAGAPPELVEKLGGLLFWLGRPESAVEAFQKLEDEPRREFMRFLGDIVRGKRMPPNGGDRVGLLLANRPSGDPLSFALAVLRAQIAAEAGDAASARTALNEAREHAATPGRKDHLERLSRLLP